MLEHASQFIITQRLMLWMNGVRRRPRVIESLWSWMEESGNAKYRSQTDASVGCMKYVEVLFAPGLTILELETSESEECQSLFTSTSRARCWTLWLNVRVLGIWLEKYSSQYLISSVSSPRASFSSRLSQSFSSYTRDLKLKTFST